MQRFRWGLVKSLEFMNAKKPGLEMTASLLKKLLQFENRLEKDHIRTLTKDWNTFYQEGEFYNEELIVANSFKNAQKNDSQLNWVPKKRSKRKSFGVRWKEQNEIFDIENIKENIEGAISGKKNTSTRHTEEVKKGNTPTVN